jgi:glycosyltransferase involved in cell wall biosynthesis
MECVMRVLHILNDVTDRGNGIVNLAVDLSVEQARQGFVVAVASAGGGYQPLLQRMGVLHLTLDQSRNPVQILCALRTFRRQLLDFRPDIVHAHMRTGLLLAYFWSHFQRYVLVSHVHNVHDRESVVMGLAHRVIAVSRSVADSMTEMGIPKEKLRVVLNRTLGSPRQLPLDQIEPVRIARPSIVTVGGMTTRKGIEELIAAFNIVGREFTGAHLYLVGDGAERQRFEELALKSPHYNRIHFERFQKAPQAYMLSADVFVLASRRESFGLVLTEARAAGCAIVATDVDGIAEALDGGRAGILIPSQDPQAIAKALSHLLISEEERAYWQRSALGGIDEYCISRMALEVSDVYFEILQGKKWHRVSDTAWFQGRVRSADE